ncbi:hypothetical protein [Pseudopelagicola sp. nBUS_19]|uniref:hypothetical protein n=1 Tax=Pseudopelagicola sp. nBUS_19 TaxID=3395316 RepID=UPI003EBB839F
MTPFIRRTRDAFYSFKSHNRNYFLQNALSYADTKIINEAALLSKLRLRIETILSAHLSWWQTLSFLFQEIGQLITTIKTAMLFRQHSAAKRVPTLTNKISIPNYA